MPSSSLARPDPTSPAFVEHALLADGSLALHADAGLWRWVESWVPRVPPSAGNGAHAVIRVERGAPCFEVPNRKPLIELRSVSGWAEPSGRVLLCEPGRRLSAVVDPPSGRATVRLAERGEPTPAWHAEVWAALTLAAALLLGRLGRTLVHAGAVVAPDGRAWLLVGGTFSGKSTTCVNLIRRGWDYLSDDHVVLAAGPSGVQVEGWPRKFNLDTGYERGSSEGVRRRVDPAAWGPGRWRRAAPLGGLLFPRVEAPLATALEPMGEADALVGLLEQSPWLVGDPASAPAVLSLLRHTARARRFRLRLGNDCYGDAVQLENIVSSAVAGS
jgi:hypothetical protein